MEWVFLFIAGLFEAAWAIGLKYTEGFTKLYPSILTVVCMSFLCTDTKGDLFRNYGAVARDYYGYNISVIDLRNPTRSDGNNLLHLVNKYMLILKNRGGFSDYKKIERESTSIWHTVFYYHTWIKAENQTAFGLQKLHLAYKTGFLITKTAFRLQTSTCRLQTLHFGLQSGISFYYWIKIKRNGIIRTISTVLFAYLL